MLQCKVFKEMSSTEWWQLNHIWRQCCVFVVFIKYYINQTVNQGKQVGINGSNSVYNLDII